MNLKNKILVILLAIFIFTTCLFGYNLFIKKDSNTKTYTCTKEVKSSEQGFNLNLKYIITVNSDGSVASGKNITSYIYSDEKVYSMSKEYYQKNPSETDKYEFEDNNKTIIVTTDDTNINKPDDKGNINEIWYKSYLKNYESMEYTCK